ncbi:MAG: hypothetical protein COA42_03490 [Alteromonadaceae bacterium]|nr:MAG: hypothetical protein COA42_03490 [Alteromonadaceae bacterium]
MRVLILSTAFSGMAQRLLGELSVLGHTVDQHYDLDPTSLRAQLRSFQPDVVLCPFLTQKIPEDIWQQYLCLIVHPGIEGDRGASSLDWAITEADSEWGVTLLQAADEMDAGDIWGTQTFPMRNGSKTSIYKREVTTAAMDLIVRALDDIASGDYQPRKLDYTNSNVRGRLRPNMKRRDRAIDWDVDSTEEIINRLNAADSRPGVRSVINGFDVNMFGAKAEPVLKGAPGDVLAVHRGAICCGTTDGAVWIRQLKCNNVEGLAPIKMPASTVLGKICRPDQIGELGGVDGGSVVDDVWVESKGDVAYVYFNFYNGAMGTQQCIELKHRIQRVKQSDVKIIVLMGGDDFWSNGIHLNVIEGANDPALESWRNINAIDDVVMEIMNTPNQMTVAALRNNAGAGGAIMALACDEVVIRDGVVLNPHYKTMGLYGSEYWTYLLPKHVGELKAKQIMDECQPMLAEEAVQLGVAEVMMPEDWDTYHQQLFSHCEQLLDAVNFDDFLSSKMAQFNTDNETKPFATYRMEELKFMREAFYDLDSEYHLKRHNFVYKIKEEKQSSVVELTMAFAS